MAVEKLIDANKLWIAFDEAGLFDDGNPRHIAQQTVEEQPAVDAVEVIRCKECKSYDPGYIRPYCGWCSTWETAVRESGYCHHGERRTE